MPCVPNQNACAGVHYFGMGWVAFVGLDDAEDPNILIYYLRRRLGGQGVKDNNYIHTVINYTLARCSGPPQAAQALVTFPT